MKKNKKKSKGMLTLDFIFSFFVTWGMVMVFLLMSFTLIMSSVSQYIIFATNRAHISGHVNVDQQDLMATTKFENLAGSFGSLLSTGTESWYRAEIELPETPAPALGPRQVAYGYKLNFTATILQNAEFPIIGGPGSDSGDANFGRATLKAYMYREPTTTECLNFNRGRWEKILDRFQNLGPYITGSDPYGASADNGC